MKASEVASASLNVKEKSPQASIDSIGQIEHFQIEVHSLNFGSSVQVTKNNVKLAKRGAQIETYGDSPHEME